MKRTLLFFCLCICFLFTCFHRYTPIQLEKVKPTVIQVEVKGAVQHPGVYTLKWNDTVSSLIKASGGLLENGDDSTLSYTRILQDHDVIVVGAKKDNSITLVSINAASLEDLETLPGIGPAIAQRIIDYRKDHSFQSLEQIQEVKGIGPALYAKIKDQICL